MRVKYLLVCIALVLLLAGCAPQGKTGSIVLQSPPDGAIIYSSALTVAGTAAGVNSGGFIITVTDETGAVLTRKDAPDRDAPFSYELIHGYSGQPAVVTITLTAADAPEEPPYATTQVMLASLEHRPEGAYLDVLAPLQGEELGGDEITVHGRASGLAAPTFTVELVGSDGAVIASQVVTLPPSYIADDLPWQAMLKPAATTGSALIRISAPDGAVLATVPVVLSAAAG